LKGEGYTSFKDGMVYRGFPVCSTRACILRKEC